MSKKGTKALASATLLSLVLTTALSAGPVKAAATGQTTRIAGADRYATAAAVATKDGKTNDNVVLVSGEGYADAVSGSVLAKTIDAPILLTQSNTLSADTTKALNTLKPKNIYVIGGTASVSQSIRDQLKDGGYNLVELGGANRYETNVAVANELVKNHGVSADKVMVVGGEGFSDALSVAPVAAAKGQILLLGSNNQNDMKSVIDFVNTNKSNATVVGTSNIMNDSILKALGVNPSTRINGGEDRFATNLNVLKAFSNDLKADSIYVANATADDGYADALVASALAGKTASPLILVDTDNSSATSNALNYYNSEKESATNTYVVGGEGVISKDLYAKFGGQSTNPVDNNDVKSIESVGLNQIKIVFDTDVDEDSAESIGNYKIDGSELKTDDAVANLKDDNRTVLITLAKSKQQGKSYTVSVKNGVLSEDKTKSIEAKDQSVTFSDTQAPTVSSVTAKGNSKLTVVFSEPVKVPVNDTAVVDNDNKVIGNIGSNFTSKFKINDQNMSSKLDSTKTEVKNAVWGSKDAGSKYVWTDEVDFHFSSKLGVGSNMLTVTDGDSNKNVLSDAAGFYVQKQDQSFNVDEVSTKPTVKEVTADPDGTIWVRFDRAMDDDTATKQLANYKLNGHKIDGEDGDSIYGTANIKLKENDCTVKITNLSGIPFGANSLYITDDVKDAYGNNVDKDTRVSFNMEKDETKPTLKSMEMIDSETIRLTFSKDIDKYYATDIDNYTLKDSDNVDITDHIKVIKPANKSLGDEVTAKNIDLTDIDNDSVWDIKINKDQKLTSEKYSLTIKNLEDTTFKHNIIDEVTQTINGTDTDAPKIVSAYRKDANGHKIVLTFSEAMDSSALTDISNYQYKNGNNDSKDLPSDTDITAGNDNKSVTIELPDNYYAYDNGTSTTTQAINANYKTDDGTLVKDLDDDNKVTAILASGLKDESGNGLDSFGNSADVKYTADNANLTYKNNTYRIEQDGSDLKVRLQFSNLIDLDTITNNNLITVAGQVPDGITTEGSDLVLTFDKGSKAADKTTVAKAYGYSDDLIAAAKEATGSFSDDINKGIDKADMVRLAGSNAEVKISGDVKDITGASPKANQGGFGEATDGKFTINPSKNGKYVFNYNVAPKTTSDYWYATNNANVSGTTQAAVVITFDTTLDTQYTKAVVDDFKFTVNNKSKDADNVMVKGNSLIFLFNYENGKSPLANTNVRVSLNHKDSITVKALIDGNGDNAEYDADKDDLSPQDLPKTFDTTLDVD